MTTTVGVKELCLKLLTLYLSPVAASAAQRVEQKDHTNVSENKSKLDSGVEELLRDF
jgi:hypothetical protein